MTKRRPKTPAELAAEAAEAEARAAFERCQLCLVLTLPADVPPAQLAAALRWSAQQADRERAGSDPTAGGGRLDA